MKPEHEYGKNELNTPLNGLAREIGTLLKEELPNNIGFMVILFSFKGPDFSYVSNGNREDVKKMLLEFISKTETPQA